MSVYVHEWIRLTERVNANAHGLGDIIDVWKVRLCV